MAEPISIVVTSYNYEAFIGQTLTSIEAQSFPHWQALVVDDGSVDGSLSVIQGFCARDSRFQLLQHPGGSNRGLAESLRLGISQATARKIAFCESDDWWDPRFLEALSDASRKRPAAGVVFTDVALEGTSEAMAAHCAMLREHFRRGGSAIELYMDMKNAVPSFSCAMVEADLIRQCDFSAHFAPSLDMWLWAQLAARTGFFFVDAPLCHWRQHDLSYMKKEVEPNRLDMARVLEFHRQIRAVLGGLSADGARASVPKQDDLGHHPGLLRGIWKSARNLW